MKRFLVASVLVLTATAFSAHDAGAAAPEATGQRKVQRARRGWVQRGQGVVRAARETLTRELGEWKAKEASLKGTDLALYQARTRVLGRLHKRLEGTRAVHRVTLKRIAHLSQRMRELFSAVR